MREKVEYTYVSTTATITLLGVHHVLVIDAPASATPEICTGSYFNELMTAAVMVNYSSAHVEDRFA